ncbi:aldose 1-epimerase family protein [Rhizobium halophytocola]|uniref:Galactose mutarotase-like enzyme n=1 Tax=Rhizobium halophytocola TaxID=735519 RepID=A0ABS4E5Y6_9HYPH|nr:aldose 1-epimerase family protein [Rhizobium halophytocola]MBP1853362.1 galactose mutarotase-like enzyme [Rhizobium halophytocola]
MSDRIRIANDTLTVEVSSLGAEMQRLDTADGRAYLWNGDDRWWSGRSPILFPIVGKAPDDTIAINGKSYPMKQHGFARRSEFALMDSGADFCRHALTASETTLAAYPYAFSLVLEHRLDGATLTVTATVTNAGAEPMPYGIGFHPAFRWPLPGAENTPHLVTLDNGAEPQMVRLEGGLIAPDLLPSPFTAGTLALSPDLFEADALIFPEGAGKGLRFGPKDGAGLTFTFDNLPNIALWQKPGAPFLCVEPWHGMAARSDASAELTERPFTVALAAGDSAAYGFSVTVPV